VTIFGPRLTDPGGMASVARGHLAVLEDAGVPVQHVATYTSRSRSAATVCFILAMLSSIRRRGAISVAHLHVSQRGSIVRGVLLARVLNWRGAAIVCTVHGSGFRRFAERHPRLVRALLAQLEIVTVLSSSTLGVVRRLRPSADVRLLPNAVILPAGSFLTRPENLHDVLFAGEIGTRKGVDTLLAAWGALSTQEKAGGRLLLAGPRGDMEVASRGDVIWLGAVSPEEVAHLLVRSRLGVLPSRAEAMPMFVLEVMAHGRPIITTDIEDLRLVVGEGGLIVAPADTAELSHALHRALVDDEWVRAKGVKARARVARDYSLERVGEQLRAIYEDALASRGAES
jgi:glycosyltransferase involved in cell wall biosynthesis